MIRGLKEAYNSILEEVEKKKKDKCKTKVTYRY